MLINILKCDSFYVLQSMNVTIFEMYFCHKFLLHKPVNSFLQEITNSRVRDCYWEANSHIASQKCATF